MREALRDVAVVGAGPGGSCAAYYLARSGVDVVLLDKASFPRDKPCGDIVTRRGLSILHEMGVLKSIGQLATMIDSLQMTSPGGRVVDARVASSACASRPLITAPRLILDDALRQRAVASGARFEDRVHVSYLKADGRGIVVEGVRDRVSVAVRARLAIVAVGASTGLLARSGLLRHRPRLALAARAYYSGISELGNSAHLRFDGVTLPGYGWAFPLTGSSANVGVGYLPPRASRAGPPRSVRTIFEGFVSSPPLRRILSGAQRVGPVTSYPLRTDFIGSPTSGERVLLVGEAAGLVNPLTGEGIGFALQSGQIAASHATRVLGKGEPSRLQLLGYDLELRRRYLGQFVYLTWLRALFLNRPGLDSSTWLAHHHAGFRERLVGALLDGGEGTAARLALSSSARLERRHGSALDASSGDVNSL